MTERIHPAAAPSPAASPSTPILEESKRQYQQKVPDQLFPPHPAAYVPPRRRRRSCCGSICRCLCWLLAVVAILIVLLGITALIFWLVIRPVHSPDYNIQDVSISQLNISTATTPPQLTSIVSFTVRADNPNRRIGIYYDRVAIYLYYAGIQVGQSTIDPFYQGHRNVTFLRSNLTSTDLPVSQELATRLSNDITQNRVPLEARVRVNARIRIGAIRSPRVKVRSHCSIHVRPPTAPDGAGLLDRNCNVRVRL